MNIPFNILFVLIILVFQKNPYYNEQGRPSSFGIEKFINENHDNLIAEYEYKIDSLYDVYIYTDDLGEFEDSHELGIFYIPDEILITNKEKFIEYEFKNLSMFKQKNSHYNERTVKAVIFHELTHVYFHQMVKSRINNNLFVSPEYKNFRIYPNTELSFGAEFIEEGICEYTVFYLEETHKNYNYIKPDNKEDLLDPKNNVNILYQYSISVLSNFLDENGIKKGIEILITNKPPSYEEILNPELFFNRLN